MKVLIAGVGNMLRADDGFGVEVAQRMARMELPADVSVVETGIGGIALVQELQSGYDALVIVDCVDLGRPPGQVMLIEPEVIDVDALTWTERHDILADMHLATPERAMMLARALGVLPSKLLMVGCQPVDPDAIGQGLSAPVTAGVGVAIDEIVRHVGDLLAADAGSSAPPTASAAEPGPAGVIAASPAPPELADLLGPSGPRSRVSGPPTVLGSEA
ncbi:MAG: hydrogenase maturation protease [Acidimicrobiales bacterium]